MSETTARSVDCLVIGAGIAGASIAANLAPHLTVAVLEAEAHAGYHTTGRSAALYSALYGNAPVRALTRASRPFFDRPPAGFAEVPLLRARDTLYLIGAGQQAIADRFAADEDVRAHTRRLEPDEVIRRIGILRRERIEGALLDDTSADIDVDALHQGFLRLARAGGVRVHLGASLRELVREKAGWLARTDSFCLRAPLVINAAGAWADAVAQMAGVAPLPLQPLRRTAALIDVPAGVTAAEAADWPAVIAIDESHYFKPDAGLLLISPADETPSPPCDAQPEELDVAIAVDRFETLSGQRVARVRHRWAGLRVFSPDRTPVAGFDATAPGFFWCAGQGGYGIQTAPALARAAAALALGQDLPDDIAAAGVHARDLSPRRFRNA